MSLNGSLQSDGHTSTQSSIKFIGFRDVELVRDPLPDGETFYFRVNGDAVSHMHTHTCTHMHTHTHTCTHMHIHTRTHTHTHTHAHTHTLPFPPAGIPVFAKGGNLIPLDAFESRVTSAYLRKVLGAAVIANQNMIRVW